MFHYFLTRLEIVDHRWPVLDSPETSRFLRPIARFFAPRCSAHEDADGYDFRRRRSFPFLHNSEIREWFIRLWKYVEWERFSVPNKMRIIFRVENFFYSESNGEQLLSADISRWYVTKKYLSPVYKKNETHQNRNIKIRIIKPQIYILQKILVKLI